MRSLPVFLTGALLAALAFVGTRAEAAGDPEAGRQVFGKCAVCHSSEPGRHKIGPSLAGVIGRTAGTAEGYRYSKAMTAYGAAGTVWNAATLQRFLAAPRKVVKGTRMTFPGLKDETDRENVIAYLKEISQAP